MTNFYFKLPHLSFCQKNPKMFKRLGCLQKRLDCGEDVIYRIWNITITRISHMKSNNSLITHQE